MRTIRTGQLAYDPSIAGARLAALAAPTDNSDALVEAYLQATAPKAYAYAGGRMLFDHPPVQVSRVCMRERRFRFAKVTFNYVV